MAITMENKEKRGFLGMWIPADIWLHPDLNITEKCLVAEIVSLNSTPKGCFANNGHFSKILNLSKNRVSAILSKLQEKGWIELTHTWEGKQIVGRKIAVTFTYGPTGLPEPKPKNESEDPDDTPDEEDTPNEENGTPETEGGIPNTEEGVPKKDSPIPKSEEGIPNIRKVNNHLSNHLSNQLNKETMSGKPDDASEIPYESIVSYLNKKANKKFKHSTPGTRKLIKARVNEGFVLDDFNIVVDNQTHEWRDTDMDQYLRPLTLFGNKFESYLNNTPKPKQSFSGKGNGRSETLPDWAYEENKGEEIDLEKQKEHSERLARIRNRGKEGVQ